MMDRVSRVTLTQFRSYAGLTWAPSPGVSVLTGPNGSGKTNVLEAVSLLVPGRGLRQARLADLARVGSTSGWGVAARLGPVTLATGALPGGASDRRVFRLNGLAPRSQAEVAAALSAVWLVPQMDRLFQDGASARRRFLDRLVWSLEPGHAREVSAYETALASRNRLLGQNVDPAWLAATEDSMARHAVAATAARAALVDRLNAAGPASLFPAAHLTLLDPLTDRLRGSPALAVEDWLRDEWAGSRVRDAGAGMTRLGAHRADMALSDAATSLPAAQASTGQQKALLIGVILAHAGLIASARGAPPLLLLDEPAVHLDADRRNALWSALLTSGAQVMLTGTDRDAFAPLRDSAQGWETGGGALRPDPWFTPDLPMG